MSEPGIIFSAQVQPNMVFPTAVIEGVQPLHVENREPRGRYARPFPVTNAERRETHSDDEAHILAIRRGVQAIRRWMNRLPAGSYTAFLTVWYTPMNEGRDNVFRARQLRTTGRHRAVRQSGIDADGELHIGETQPLKSPDDEDASQCRWGNDGMYQPAGNDSG